MTVGLGYRGRVAAIGSVLAVLHAWVAVAGALVAVAVLLGPGIVAGVGMPSSPLHFLLAAMAVLTVPALRFLAIRRTSTRVGWWMATGATLTLLALLSLWSTGS
jgi:hypothetical protein